ncbi:MAG: DUF4856 domain-containing protein [Chitinophagaceae bacterium]|nr:DUF4856 domain-containing protein [Chitinophagaceae bacterium]
MKKVIILGFVPAVLFMASCKKENTTTNITPTQELKIPYNTLTTTSNYENTFVDDNGKSTVDFSGQTTRRNMLKELDGYIKTGLTVNISATKMADMFQNQNNAFADANLNAATSKQLNTKTAASFNATAADAERQRFMGYFSKLESLSMMNTQTASQGQAGVLDGKRLVDEKGVEYAQLVSKGFIGALMLDQIANVYLGTDKQSADNTTPESGSNYTAMAHHWDEAYGYLTSNSVYPVKGEESYLGEYARQGTSIHGTPEQLYLTFLKGRAAIVNNDLTTRDEQITYIRSELEKAVATVAISYLNKTNTATDDASRFHELSEGTGFVYSLRFAHNAKVNAAKSDELMNKLMGKTNGFWSLTASDIDAVRDELATIFGIDKTTVVNH